MSYTVVLKFEVIEGENPLDATKNALKWIKESAHKMIYEVTDEITDEKFDVDLDNDDVTPCT